MDGAYTGVVPAPRAPSIASPVVLPLLHSPLLLSPYSLRSWWWAKEPLP